jgi:hypothetical protein
VPVHRPEDAAAPVTTFASRETRAGAFGPNNFASRETRAGAFGPDNKATFERANALLRRRATLAIFPEGTTHDRLELARVRTGAARIALGAHAAGIQGVTIVPIGLTFDDKLALRSRVLAHIGDAIDVDTWVTTVAASEGDRTAVRLLTDTIRSRLSDVTPRYSDVLERAILGRAADVRLRADLDDPGRTVALAQREALAQRMSDAPASATNAVIAAQGAYQLRLDLVRLRDEHLVPPLQRRWLLRHALALTAYIALLGVVVAAGIAINLLPALATAAAGRRPLAPVTKGTVRVLTALIVFPLTWITVVVALPITGVLPITLAVAACPICGAVAVGGIERTIALKRAWAGWLGLHNARDLLGPIRAARDTVCSEVDAAVSADASVVITRAAAARPERTPRSDRRQADRPPT